MLILLRALVQELDDVGLLATAATPFPPAPTAEGLKALRFLGAVFMESLRVLPPVASGTVRKLACAVEADGVRLPEGSTVVISPWGLHHSTAIWGADAKHWSPDRWLDGRTLHAIKRDDRGALRWHAFGLGSQSCVAQHLATVRTSFSSASMSLHESTAASGAALYSARWM